MKASSLPHAALCWTATSRMAQLSSEIRHTLPLSARSAPGTRPRRGCATAPDLVIESEAGHPGVGPLLALAAAPDEGLAHQGGVRLLDKAEQLVGQLAVALGEQHFGRGGQAVPPAGPAGARAVVAMSHQTLVAERAELLAYRPDSQTQLGCQLVGGGLTECLRRAVSTPILDRPMAAMATCCPAVSEGASSTGSDGWGPGAPVTAGSGGCRRTHAKGNPEPGLQSTTRPPGRPAMASRRARCEAPGSCQPVTRPSRPGPAGAGRLPPLSIPRPDAPSRPVRTPSRWPGRPWSRWRSPARQSRLAVLIWAAVVAGTRYHSGAGGSWLSSDDTPQWRTNGTIVIPRATRRVVTSVLNGRAALGISALPGVSANTVW